MSLQLPTRRQSGPDRDASGDAGPPKKRRRPALACVQCRRRKIRCDQQKPCNNCTKSRITDCTFPETHQPGSLERSDSLRRETPTLAPRTPNSTANHSPHPVSVVAPSTTNSVNNLTNRERQDDSNVNALLARISDLEQTVSKLSGTSGSHNSDPVNAKQSGSVTKDGHTGLRFNNQSAWVNHTSLVGQDESAFLKCT